MQIFDVIIFFKLRTIQQKTVKPTYLCPLGARKLAEGKGLETASDLLLLIIWSSSRIACMQMVFLHKSFGPFATRLFLPS